MTKAEKAKPAPPLPLIRAQIGALTTQGQRKMITGDVFFSQPFYADMVLQEKMEVKGRLVQTGHLWHA